MPGGFYDFECGSCGRQFPAGWQARENHCRSTGHRAPNFECDRCERWFNSEDARIQHMRATNHFSHDCDFCNDTFPNEAQKQQHEKNEHFYCEDCDRTFMNYHNLDAHLKSRTHLGTTIACPFCGAKHATATGLTHHLESSSCPNAPQIDRDSLYQLVRSKDPTGVLTKKMIGWTGKSETYEATDRAWNGHAFECYFCHRGFSSLRGLNQHLASPAHQQPLYHCFNASCRQNFKTLGALVNHLESEKCGAMRFDRVQRGIDDLVRRGRLLN